MAGATVAPTVAKTQPTRASESSEATRAKSPDKFHRLIAALPVSAPGIPADPPAQPRFAASGPIFLQTKLAIGAVDDPLEREADMVAEKVMRMEAAPARISAAAPQIARKCEECKKHEEEEKLHERSGPEAAGNARETKQEPQARPKCKTCEDRERDRKLQMKSSGLRGPACEPPAIVHSVLNTSGRTLDADSRDFFESRFGHDFSQVRIHADTLAQQSARAIRARAYTVGNHIAFAAGEFAPGTPDGQRLLAHELAHVVQQTQGAVTQLRRAPDGGACKTGHLLGSAELIPKSEVDVLIDRAGESARADFEEAFYYRVWGTWRKGDTPESFASRVLNAWIPWRFGPMSPQDRTKVFDYIFRSVLERIGSGIGAEGCDYAIALGRTELAKITESSGEPRREAERRRARETLRAEAEGKLDLKKASVAERLVLLENRIRLFWTANSDEAKILEILKTTPTEQAEELSRRLSTDRVDDETFAEALDRVVDLGNNRELHEELTKLHLRGLGEKKGLESLMYKAPVLPWHDVMGIFGPVGGDVPATFSPSKGPGGKVVVKYHQGFTLTNTTMPFQSEIDALPAEVKWSGVTYEPDQMLAVHDWDEGRFVMVRARDLIAYEHIGIRNWLGQMATVASLAVPGGALAGSAAKFALGALKIALTAFIFVVQENRLSIVKWFPTWGPRMIEFADIAQLALTLYDIGAMARSGARFIAAWREARFARKLWEAANAVDEAEQVAVKMENEADKVFHAYDEARQVENAAGHAPGAKAPSADLENELGGKVGKPGPQPHGAPAVRESPLAQEPVGDGHHVEVTRKGVEVCSPPPCPLLDLEYAAEFKKSQTLTKEMGEIEALRKSGDAAAAAKKAAPLQQTLEQFRNHPKLFESLQAHATLAQQQELAGILASAEKAGIRIDPKELEGLSERLAAGKALEQELAVARQQVNAAIEFADAKAAKISPLNDIPESLGFKPDFIKSFQARATPAQQRRLALLLEKAERSGVHLDKGVADELSRRLFSAEDLEQELTGIERQLESAVEVHGEAGKFNRPGKQTFPEPTDPTTIVRATPGTASGGENLDKITGHWVQTERGRPKGSTNVDYRILPMPGQIADKLRNRRFANFDAFRAEFWRLVAKEKNLADDFAYDSRNLGLMNGGQPPFAPPKALTGTPQYGAGRANAVYQIDHIRALKNGGGLYDLDNMHIVTWLTHVLAGE